MDELYTLLILSVVYTATLRLIFRHLSTHDQQMSCRLHAWRWLAESRVFVCDTCAFEAG